MENNIIELLKPLEKLLGDTLNDFMPKYLKLAANEKIYTMAFITDNCYRTLVSAFQTKEAFQENIAQNGEECIEDKWYPDEWKYREYMVENSPFEGYCQLLNRIAEQFDCTMDKKDPERRAFNDMFVDIVANAVNAISNQLFLDTGQNKNDITFFVSMTDDDFAIKLENMSVVKMNNSALSEPFLKRYDHLV